MTAQPIYPQAPPQPQYAPPQAQPQYAQPQAPQYPPQQQPYYPQQPAPQQYGGYPPQGQQPPAQPLASGSLDDYYSQPTSGGGPSISWSTNGMPKPEGTAYAGIVSRDVVDGDIQQQTDPKTGQPKFYRDGRPQFVMKVPLLVQPSAEFPDGEATLFVRGQMRDELVRAMGEVGAQGAPKNGDTVVVTLVQRKPSRGGGMPMNVFAIQYAQAGGQVAPQQGSQGAPAAAPTAPPQAVQQQAPQPPTQPQQQYVPQQPAAPQAPVAQPVQQQPPVQQAAPSAPQPPAGMTPEQQQLLAGLTGGQG